MYRRILVPTDFSELAGKAIEHGAELARQVDAELIVFHAFVRPIVPSMPAGDRALRQYLDEAAQASARQLEALVAGLEGVRCRAISREGRPWEEIVAVAEREDCDLVCMSTHGHGGLAHVFLGSVTEKVIHRAPCPVLVIRGRPPKVRRSRARPPSRLRMDEDGEE
jgi:universal stress protein A